MISVSFTSALKTFFPHLKNEQVQASSISALIQSLDIKYHGLSDYLLDEKGEIREHVKLYIDNEPVDKVNSAVLGQNAQVHIIQAISGG